MHDDHNWALIAQSLGLLSLGHVACARLQTGPPLRVGLLFISVKGSLVKLASGLVQLVLARPVAADPVSGTHTVLELDDLSTVEHRKRLRVVRSAQVHRLKDTSEQLRIQLELRTILERRDVLTDELRKVYRVLTVLQGQRNGPCLARHLVHSGIVAPVERVDHRIRLDSVCQHIGG